MKMNSATTKIDPATAVSTAATATKKIKKKKEKKHLAVKKWLTHTLPDTMDQLVIQPLQDLVKDISNSTSDAVQSSHDTVNNIHLREEPQNDSDDSSTEKEDNYYGSEEEEEKKEDEENDIRETVTAKSSVRGSTELLLRTLTPPAQLQVSTIQQNNNNSIRHLSPNKNKSQGMVLKLLRGKNLPTEPFELNIYYQSGDTATTEAYLDLIATVRGIGDINNNTIIWGGCSNSWDLHGNQQDAFFVFELQRGNSQSRQQGAQSSSPSRETAVATNTPQTRRKHISRLLPRAHRHPNAWIRFDSNSSSSNNNNNDDDDESNSPAIQIRLGFTRQQRDWKLHPQEDCPRLSPGPGLAAPFTSYRIRKEALWSCCPVMLNVYDVSTNSNIETINKYTKAIGAGGIFHAAIEVNGKEYSFGGTHNQRSTVTGVFSCPPKQCPMHHYRESIYLGDCELGDPNQIDLILAALRPQWLARSYNLFRKNCCFFSQELAIQLGVGDIPAWVYSLATTAEFIEPYAIRLNQYMIERARAKAKRNMDAPATATAKTTSVSASSASTSSPSPATTLATKEECELISMTKRGDADVETQEVMLDHAMAVRIQRSFRRKPTFVTNTPKPASVKN